MTDFQAAASRQGRQFADQCDQALDSLDFERRGKLVLRDIGVEVDQAAATPSGRELWFEYKGSIRGDTPGLRRTDTTKKAIANAALVRTIEGAPPFIVLTSHMPERGAALAMIETAVAHEIVAAAICIYDRGWEEELRAFF